MDNRAIEVGLLEKRVRKSRHQLLLFLFIGVVHLVACLVLFILYEGLYETSTRGTAAVIGVAMGGLSESVLQLYTRKYSFPTIVEYQVWGAFNGIWTRSWTEMLYTHLQHPLLMILADQLFGNPLAIFFYTGLNAFWQGYDIDLYMQKNYKSTLKISLIIWPVASCLQFTVVPENFIVLFNIIVNFVWVLILGMQTPQ